MARRLRFSAATPAPPAPEAHEFAGGLNEAIRRRTRVARIVPNSASCLRPLQALRAETLEAWLEDNRDIDTERLKEQKKAAMKLAA